jgi:GNAT superfamily N-acetyltransferase
MQDTVHVEVIRDPQDLLRAFEIQCASFGAQAKDALWIAMNPGWDTLAGKKEGAARTIKRFQATTTNNAGQTNTIFLKATVSDADSPIGRVMSGVAIWQQLSEVPGYGDPVEEDVGKSLGVAHLHPDNESEQRFLAQAFTSLHKRRFEVVKEKKESNASPPATFVLDLCAVDPAFQRRGIAGKLVQFGLEEAQRRGGLEATTEASSMGRGVYQKLGFKAEGDGKDIEYVLDGEFRHRSTPPNVFLRTQR